MANQMKVKGKDVNNEDAQLTINLADDLLEVRGFGKPITRAKAREMAEAYFKEIEAAETIINEIVNNPKYADLKNENGFMQLKSLLDPRSQTVSGVFGKEIILQILSMRNCEGIRYIVGKDQGKNTVILIGVQDEGITEDENGVKRALSAPVKLRSTGSHGDVAVDGEVHESSLNIAQARAMITERRSIFQNRTDILFATF